ncbi:hypothetical protein [Sphingopyxis sp.]|uniref:hypothetical protein n=1 Tax=Sphingopyxis sp. TaxID=1908224 RepID=UPI003BAB65DE
MFDAGSSAVSTAHCAAVGTAAAAIITAINHARRRRIGSGGNIMNPSMPKKHKHSVYCGSDFNTGNVNRRTGLASDDGFSDLVRST